MITKLLLFLLATTIAFSQSIVKFNFNDYDLIADQVAPNIQATDISTGSESLSIYQNGSLPTAFVNQSTGLSSSYTSAAQALTAGQYFTTTISTSEPFFFSPQSLTFDLSSSSNGADNYAVYVDVDNSGTFTLLGNSTNNANTSFSGNLESHGQISSLEVAIVIFNANGYSGSSSTELDNLEISATPSTDLALFDFNDFDYVVDAVNFNISASDVTTGSTDLSLFQNGALPNAFVSRGTGLNEAYTTAEAALAGGQYLTTTIESISGYTITPDTLSLDVSAGSNGASNFAVYVDINKSGAPTLLGASSNPTNSTYSESLASYQNLTSLEVFVVLFNSGSNSTSSSTQLDNLLLTGTSIDIDPDNDGLTTEEEGNTYFTDSNNADTDSDSFPDGVEILYGSDPNDMTDTPAVTTLSGITSPGSVSAFLNGNLPTSTPATNIGEPNWQSEHVASNLSFPEAMVVKPLPETDYLLVAQRTGELVMFDYTATTPTKVDFGDLSSITTATGLGGLMEVEFHPEFNDPSSANRNYLYVFYTTTATTANGFSDPDGSLFIRVSRFTRDEATGMVDINSELVMIQQHFFDTGGFSGGFVHLASGMTFGNDGFLYITFGDFEATESTFNYYLDTQRIDRVFQCALIAIDVDQQGGSVSSAPTRTLQGNTGPNAKTGTTQSCDTNHLWYHADNHSGVGYYIPKTNFWHKDNNVPPTGTAGTFTLDGGTVSYPAHGDALEEHVAHGLRNVFSMCTDPVTGAIAMFEVGSNNSDRNFNSEEINIFTQGANYGWPYIENGISQTSETTMTRPPGSTSRSPALVGTETEPTLAYLHRPDTGRSILGGLFYHGTKHSTLTGTLIGGDFTSGKVYSVDLSADTITESRLLSAGRGMRDISESPDGEDIVWCDGTTIYRLFNQTEFIPEPPALLSNTGAFSDTTTLTPADGVIGYEPIAPLWSDRAKKPRFMAIPNDGGTAGTYDLASEKITFSEDGNWVYPIGTVFIKNFVLPTDEGDPDNPEKQHIVETRFIVKGDDSNMYAFSYRWREDQTEADLIPEGDTTALNQDVTITKADGSTYTQTWFYPTRTQCFDCHQVPSGESLGVNTRQLNHPFTYSTGETANQLTTLNELGLLDTSLSITDILNYLSSSNISDETATLEHRVKSYLDSNCAYCHQPDSAAGRALFDARLSTDLLDSHIINGAFEAGDLGLTNPAIIVPGDPENSLIFHRDQSDDPNVMMPPVGRSVADDEYLAVLTKWIHRIGLDGFDAWAAANSVMGGIDDDQDNDGQVEYFEYLTQHDPNDAMSKGLSLSPVQAYTDTSDNSSGFEFSWIVKSDATLETDYLLHASADLASFTKLEPNTGYIVQSETDLGDGTKRVTVRIPDDTQECYLRLTSPL